MSKAKVLYIHVTASTSEVLKNLVLAGIQAALFDPRPFPLTGTPSFFLASAAAADPTAEPAAKKVKPLTVAEAVQPAVEDLNPLLGACPIIDAADVAALVTNPSQYLADYSVVVASRLTPSQATVVSQAVTATGGQFFLLDTFGMNGACVMDLGPQHRYRPEMGKQLLDWTSLTNHVPLSEIWATPLHEAVNRFHKNFPPVVWARYRLLLAYYEQTNTWPSDPADFGLAARAWLAETSPTLKDHEQVTAECLESLGRVASAELAPVASVLGGLVGNEIIKALSGKGTPANNTLLLDGLSGKAWTFLVQPNK
jgi:ubiquitin-like 1-activating enzyme E1 A